MLPNSDPIKHFAFRLRARRSGTGQIATDWDAPLVFQRLCQTLREYGAEIVPDEAHWTVSGKTNFEAPRVPVSVTGKVEAAASGLTATIAVIGGEGLSRVPLVGNAMTKWAGSDPFGLAAKEADKLAERLYALLIRHQVIRTLNTRPGFKASQQFTLLDNGIAFEAGSGRFCLAAVQGEMMHASLLHARDIVLIESDQTGFSEDVRNTGGGGTSLPGLSSIFVGGAQSKSRTDHTVSHLALKITLQDLQRPVHRVVFLNQDVPDSSPVYAEARAKLEHWMAVIQQQRAAPQTPQVPQPVPQPAVAPAPQPATLPAPAPAAASVSDELQKLAALRNRGVLTQAEFEAAKARLLA